MPDPGRASPDGDEPRSLGDWLAPFFEDPALWPLLFVVGGIFSVLGAAALLLATVERSPFAAAALLPAFWISVDVAFREWRRGGFGRASACIAVLWTLSAGAAVAVYRAGWF